MKKRIVITGGPGTGKTALVRRLEELGHTCFHEVIREMTLKARQEEPDAGHRTNPLAFVQDPLAFNQKILEGRMEQFRAASDLQASLVFYDRGLPDIIAYMDYFDQPYDGQFTDPCDELRYDMAVVLPPWKEIYRQDHERLESFEEACEIHRHLERSYQECGYRIKALPPGPVDTRIRDLLDMIEKGT
ncbi:AAA family ATPase [Robiginitalea sp. SC105]|uniref:AAA family ATPase n=1 Tax=Robiginitalea sp. SC105 TaxID=2762332 RepID=UPI0016397577|nr:ATP-binding protein [Robiginitalea sp. SC105]MBC2840372.1 ATP-binding protein [Robiginitalea sp. SC105]